MMAESNKEDKFVQRLDFKDENLSIKWKTFKAQFNIFKIAKKYADLGEEERIANLLMLMGSDSVPIYEQFTFGSGEGETRTLANVLAMFDRHFEPVRNVIFERVKFNGMRQGGLPMHSFITQVHTQADNCDYGNMRDQLIRDRIVVGVTDNKLREQLVDVEGLDLATCIRKAKQFVTHHAQASKLVGGADDNLDAVYRPSAGKARNDNQEAMHKPNVGRPKNKCQFCNRDFHHRDRCPARNAVCFNCKEKGHWARSKCCKGKTTALAANEVTSYSDVTQEAEGMESLFLDSGSL
jgi:hypothetical protein